MRSRVWMAIVFLCACKHAGTGQGELENPVPAGGTASGGPAQFAWKSGADPSSGKIKATLPDGEHFSGTFLQVRSTTAVDLAGPYYDSWVGPAWGLGAPWYQGDVRGFVTAYSGKAIAHLKSAEGTRMRCRFLLRRPEAGMSGGAMGDCQLSTQQTIFDAKLSGS